MLTAEEQQIWKEQIHHFGHVPVQLFSTPHPKRDTSQSTDSESVVSSSQLRKRTGVCFLLSVDVGIPVRRVERPGASLAQDEHGAGRFCRCEKCVSRIEREDELSGDPGGGRPAVCVANRPLREHLPAASGLPLSPPHHLPAGGLRTVCSPWRRVDAALGVLLRHTSLLHRATS